MGASDGLTTYLRSRFAPQSYIGIELEINQKRVFAGYRTWAGMRIVVVATLRHVFTAHRR